MRLYGGVGVLDPLNFQKPLSMLRKIPYHKPLEKKYFLYRDFGAQVYQNKVHGLSGFYLGNTSSNYAIREPLGHGTSKFRVGSVCKVVLAL